MRKRNCLRCLARSFGAFLLLLPASCVRTAVPAYYSELKSGLQGSAAAAGPALARLGTRSAVILLRGAETVRPDVTLGHQFMLFFLPVTSVYFADGVQREVDEVLLDLLLQRGNLVITAPERVQEKLRSLPLAPPIYRASLKSPRLNAFDVFAFRILTVAGELELTEEAPGIPPQATSVEINEKSYRKFAYGPVLSYQFHRNLRSSLDSLLEKREAEGLFLGPRRSLRGLLKAGASHADSQVLLLLRPSIRGELPPDFGQRIADSFGYPNTLAYSDEALIRILQQGLGEGAPLETAPLEVSSADPSTVFPLVERGVFGESPWIVQSSVELSFGGEGKNEKTALYSHAELKVFEVSDGELVPVLQRECRSEEPLRNSEEGGAIIALRRSLAGMMEVIFRGGTEAASVRCSVR